MKHFAFVLTLAVLVSCGGNGSTANNGQEENPLPCGASGLIERACMIPAQMIVNTRMTALPKNIRIEVIDLLPSGESYRSVIASSCSGKGSLTVISNATGSSLFFKSFDLPRRESFTLEIVDAAGDCKGNVVVSKTDLVKEDVRAVEGQRGTFSIDLD